MASITRVADHDPELLRYLDRLGLRPASPRANYWNVSPFDGPLTYQPDGSSDIHALSRRVTDDVFVQIESRGALHVPTFIPEST